MRLISPDLKFEVCAINQSELDTHAYPDEVVQEIDQEDRDSYLQAARLINERVDETVVIVQHEYGIYGGTWGGYLIDFLKELRCPVITTVHTVAAQPSLTMHRVTNDIVANSHLIVTLTDTSYALFQEIYPSAQSKTVRIDHGIHPQIFMKPQEAKAKLKLNNKHVLLTFGLLGPSKGIEHVITAMKSIAAQFPNALYLVVGGTHPNIVRKYGERYRLKLMKQVNKLGLQKHVRFVDNFLPTEAILRYLQASDIYVAASLNPEQAVSGTLSYALGAGRAVVATDFAQARESVLPRVGRVVPIGDSKALASAVNSLLGNSKLLNTMHRSAYASTRSMLWSNVADNYMGFAETLTNRLARWPKLNFQHLQALTDKFGMLQFATATAPLKSSGYTLDDNARALQLVNDIARLYPKQVELCNRLARPYLRVMEICLSHSPPVNYLTAIQRRPTQQNLEENLEDSRARAYWALQSAASGPLKIAKGAKKILKQLPFISPKQQHLRTIAFRLLGSCEACNAGDTSTKSQIKRLADHLVDVFEQTALSDWAWFEPALTYANGMISASLLEAAKVTGDDRYREVGLRSLDWLISVGFMGEVYIPIGQAGWYTRGGVRTLFDQQPEDVLAMMQGLGSAYQLTSNPKYLKLLHKAFSWFLGNNLLGVRMYDDSSGGCRDGLTPEGPNANQGAESTISYLKARLLLEQLKA